MLPRPFRFELEVVSSVSSMTETCRLYSRNFMHFWTEKVEDDALRIMTQKIHTDRNDWCYAGTMPSSAGRLWLISSKITTNVQCAWCEQGVEPRQPLRLF